MLERMPKMHEHFPASVNVGANAKNA